MKISKYNKFLKTDDNKTLAFNSFSCSLAEIDNTFEDIIKNLDTINYDKLEGDQKELVDNMLLGNFIVPDEIDEMKILKYRNNYGKFVNKSLGLTIAPTLSCNFACPYCYETCKSGFISEDVQESIVKLVEQNAKLKKNIDIGWYGGEPLLAKNVICDLSEKFMGICSKFEVNYNAYMVTNGYLVDDNTIDMMKKYNISGVQITIDGPPEIHNQRRILKTGQADTFYPILKNAKKMCEKGINVSIRVNVDKTNIAYIDNLLNEFEKHDLKEKPTIYLGHVDSFTEACSSVSSTCLTTKEYAEFDMKYYKILKERGFNKNSRMYYPDSKMNYCCADSMNSYVIDPKGYMYKCWNEVGNIDSAVGNVLNINNNDEMLSNEQNLMMMRNVEYLTWSPLEVEECKECWYLPMCMGGCPYNAKHNSKNNKANCEKWRYIIDDVLKNTYVEKCK